MSKLPHIHRFFLLSALLFSFSTSGFRAVGATNCVSEQELDTLTEAVLNEMQPELKSLSRPLVLRRSYPDSLPPHLREHFNSHLHFSVSGGNKDGVLSLEVVGSACGSQYSQDAILLILCHEIGHVAGGAPYRRFIHDDILFSVEGQADYFATSQCLPRVMKLVAPSLDTSESLLPASLQARCNKTSIDKAICLRSAQAGLEVTSIFHRDWDSRLNYKEAGPQPRFDRINEKLSFSGEGHPIPQCRLNTYVAGATGRERPACWYEPGN